MLAVALTALLLAVEARRRYGARAGWIAGVLFVRRDGRVRAAGRAGRELRGVHAAVDDGGDPLRATRARRRARVSRSRSRRSPSRPARPRCSRLYLLARARGKRGVGEVALGFTHPARARRARRRAAPAPLLDGARQRLVPRRDRRCRRSCSPCSSLMTLGMWPRATCRSCGSCRARGTTAGIAALDGERDTDLWLWLARRPRCRSAVGLRFFGHYYLQLVPPLALLAAGALARAARRAVTGTIVARVVVGGRCSRPPATSCTRSACRAELRVGEPVPRRQHRIPTTRSSCGAACPRSTGRRAAARRRGSSRTSFLTGNYPGRPPDDADADADTEAAWDVLLRRTSPRTRRSTSSTRRRRRCAARSTTRSRASRASSTIVDDAVPLRRTIDGIDIYERK